MFDLNIKQSLTELLAAQVSLLLPPSLLPLFLLHLSLFILGYFYF